MKFFIEQQIAETMHFIKVMREQAHSSRNILAQLNDMISEMEAINDPEEFYDDLFCLRDNKRVEYNMLMAINDDWSLDEDLHFGNAFAVFSVSAFTCDRDIFPACLYWICSEIIEYKWALFYCLPNKSLKQGLKLIHTDNDVHSFFADAERSGKIHLYITHKQQDLGRYYLRNMVWVEEDAALRCSSSSPFSTRIKRKGGKTTKEGLRKKAKGEQKMVDDEPVGRKSVQTSRKGKEIMYEFPGPSPTKESQVSVTNYKRAIVNGKAKMVEVEDVGLVQPVRSATKVQRSTAKNLAEYYFKILTLDASDEEVKSKLKSHEKRKLDACSMSPHELVEWEQQEVGSPYLRTPPLKPRRKGIEFPCKNLFRDFLHCGSVADELVLDDNWQYEGLVVEDVGGSSKHCDLVHENVVYKGHSLPNMDKEKFSNNVVLDDVVTDNLAYTLSLVLKKKCRNKVNVTRKTRCLNNSKSMRLRKGYGKRVAIGGHGRGLGRLIGLNVDAVDDDPQVTKQVSLPARSSNTKFKDLE
ncbi:hypothetical protein Tco_0321472 [Tanacetum coccineum]